MVRVPLFGVRVSLPVSFVRVYVPCCVGCFLAFVVVCVFVLFVLS